ncbi:hypothetical protein BF14_033605 [Streptomyces griseus]|nr:hypothetical protein DIJ69_33725 [Streptomyces globisporus]PPA44142.1 hypothetical protein BF14_033605 [Streptomyces griseus]RAN21363.1 hypothetical protein A3838_32890 [Streptomyces badius]RAN29302.1 hypothetical protein A3800_32915 [Streptomyces badius]
MRRGAGHGEQEHDGAVQGSGQDESAVRRVVATACEEDGVEERAVTEGPDGAPPGVRLSFS